ARYCASGSSNEGSPCFATQVAWVRAPDRPLAFMDLGGYDETAGLVAATPLVGGAVPNLLRGVAPNDQSGDNVGSDFLIPSSSLDLVQKAHAARMQRLRTRLKLPEQRRGLDALIRAENGQGDLRMLQFDGRDQSQDNVIRVG